SDQSEFLPSEYESVQAAEIAARAFPQQAEMSALIVVQRSDGRPLTPADSEKIAQAAQTMTANVKKYATVQGFVTNEQAVAPNRSIQLITVPMSLVAGQQEGKKQS